MYVYNQPYVDMKVSRVKENYCRHFVALSNSYINVLSYEKKKVVIPMGKMQISNLSKI